jgi:phosphoketolase
MRASRRLLEREVPHSVVYVYEPGRLRTPRDAAEAGAVLDDDALAALFPRHSNARVVLSHTRPEPMLGVLRRIDTGPSHTVALGFCNRGGTLDTAGLQFANRATWAHVLQAAARVLHLELEALLNMDEINAVYGLGDPEDLR